VVSVPTYIDYESKKILTDKETLTIKSDFRYLIYKNRNIVASSIELSINPEIWEITRNIDDYCIIVQSNFPLAVLKSKNKVVTDVRYDTKQRLSNSLIRRLCEKKITADEATLILYMYYFSKHSTDPLLAIRRIRTILVSIISTIIAKADTLYTEYNTTSIVSDLRYVLKFEKLAYEAVKSMEVKL